MDNPRDGVMHGNAPLGGKGVEVFAFQDRVRAFDGVGKFHDIADAHIFEVAVGGKGAVVEEGFHFLLALEELDLRAIQTLGRGTRADESDEMKDQLLVGRVEGHGDRGVVLHATLRRNPAGFMVVGGPGRKVFLLVHQHVENTATAGLSRRRRVRGKEPDPGRRSGDREGRRRGRALGGSSRFGQAPVETEEQGAEKNRETVGHKNAGMGPIREAFCSNWTTGISLCRGPGGFATLVLRHRNRPFDLAMLTSDFHQRAGKPSPASRAGSRVRYPGARRAGSAAARRVGRFASPRRRRGPRFPNESWRP